MDIKPIEIAGRKVGPGRPCLVIAEAGVNHNGSPEMALRLVDSAAEAGVDAIKFQTFKAESLASPEAAKADYQREGEANGESQYNMLRRLELPREVYPKLIDRCKRRGLIFLSSPFDEDSAAFLEKLNVPAFKVPSGEIVNLPFLRFLAAKGKPLIVSTGMSTLGEVETAFDSMVKSGNRNIVLLHCVSNYPADPSDVNLRVLETLQEVFDVPVGYSDHTLGIAVPLAAVSLGACLIEKHLTLDRGLPGPDHQSSIDPKGLASLVEGIRIVESALGDGRKIPTAKETNIAAVVRKSLVAAHDIPVGTVLTDKMIAIRRPGTGLPPALLPEIIGRTLRISVKSGTRITMEMLS